jgi:hypothetical protein
MFTSARSATVIDRPCHAVHGAINACVTTTGATGGGPSECVATATELQFPVTVFRGNWAGCPPHLSRGWEFEFSHPTNFSFPFLVSSFSFSDEQVLIRQISTARNYPNCVNGFFFAILGSSLRKNEHKNEQSANLRHLTCRIGSHKHGI